MLHSVNVDHDNDVFVFFLGEKSGITMKLTPEEAIRIGEIGEMASLRKLLAEYQEKEDNGEYTEAEVSGMQEESGSNS